MLPEEARPLLGTTKHFFSSSLGSPRSDFHQSGELPDLIIPRLPEFTFSTQKITRHLLLLVSVAKKMQIVNRVVALLSTTTVTIECVQNDKRIDEIPPLFFTHNQIHGVDGTFIVTFNRLVQCMIHYTGHVLHAHTDRDTVTDTDVVATASSNRLERWEQRHLQRNRDTWNMLAPQESDLYQEHTDSEMDALYRDPHVRRLIQGPPRCSVAE